MIYHKIITNNYFVMNLDIQYLYLELLYQILSHLDAKTIFSIQFVSIQFKSITGKYWMIKYPDYDFEKFRNSLQLRHKIIHAIKSPIKISDCHSTKKVIITSRNDILFDKNDSNHFSIKREWYLFNDKIITDINKEHHNIIFKGEYYENMTDRSFNNIYTGKIYEYDISRLYYIRYCIGTENDILLVDNFDDGEKRVIRVFDTNNISIYEKILKPKYAYNHLPERHCLIKKDRNYILLFYFPEDRYRYVEVYDINIKKNIYESTISVERESTISSSLEFHYPFFVYIRLTNCCESRYIANVEILNLKTHKKKIIYTTKILYSCINLNIINENLFFNFHFGSKPNTLFHYNLYINEYIGKYQMGSKITAFDINFNKLATCQNDSIYVYNFDNS